MSVDAKARWLIMAMIVAADALGLRLSGMRVDGAGLLRLGLALLVLLALALFYSQWRPRERLADLAQTAAQLLLLFAACAVLSYLVTTTALPLQDAALARADHLLGFDWLAWFRWVYERPPLHALLHLAYASALPQLIAIVVYLALSGQSARNSELIWILALSLLVIIPISGMLPAASAWVYYGVTDLVQAIHLPDFTALRAGQMRELDLTQLEGLITFPSFHTTLGIVLPYALRKQRAVFVPAALLNGVMILSVPSEGGHYLVDVIAGSAVALGAILAAARIGSHMRGHVEPAALVAAS